jgi:hypothetical protein
MRKIIVISFIMLATLGMLFIPASAKESPTADKPLHITMGVVVQVKSNNDFMAIFKDLFEAVRASYNIDVKLEIHSDVEAMRKKIREKKLDMFYCWNADCDIEFYKSPDYSPAFIGTTLGMKDASVCLITRKDIPSGSIEPLKGKKIIIDGEAFSYYSLRKLIGAPPEDFFGAMASKPDPMSNLYAVSMGVYDAALVNSFSLKSMNMVNPGPLTKINRSVCGEPFKFPAIYVSNKHDRALKEKLINNAIEVLNNPRRARKNPEYKEFWPLLDKYMLLIISTKLKIIPATDADYDNMKLFFKEAEKKGWDRDYKRWKKAAEGNK